MSRKQIQEQRYHAIDDRAKRNADVVPVEPISPQPSGLFFKNLSLMMTGGFFALGSFLLVGLLRTGGNWFNDLRASLSVATPPAKVDIRSVVVQQVRGASELTTAVYSMESVVPTSRDRTLGNYVIGRTTLLYIAHGEVRAGVDLAALRPEDVQATGDTLTLRLPPPKILDSKIDVNRSKVYDYDRGFMGLGPDVAPELQELAQRETLARIVETACTDGVLQSANERAKLTVTQLLSTAGYGAVTVETQPPAADACLSVTSPVPDPAAADSLPPVPVPASPSLPAPDPVVPVAPAPVF
jgi:Protein of unknown function (DUF4230)